RRGQPAAAREGRRDQHHDLNPFQRRHGVNMAAAYWRPRGLPPPTRNASMSKSPAKPVALAVATALGGLALSGAAFSMAPLSTGYMVAAQEADAADATTAAKDAEGRCGMARADSDGDGRISAEEFAAAHPEKDPSYFA